jgi:acetyl-CoA carboxylase biotin carboxylase subunit
MSAETLFRKVLVANRGEIAVRVARSCRELGCAVVAVYSTEDRDSAVVRMADERICIGPGPARRSYANAAAVVEAALRTGADAIHPGYGFLSEDPDFAEICAAHGIVLVGPPPSVMETMGDKAAARAFARQAGLPILPGSVEPVENVEEAWALADDVGYPVIIKASAGGGGRGMEVVWSHGEFPRAYFGVRSRAQTLFGDSRVYLERFLPSVRHVESQILADRHGNALHLGARDCSVQRRHQKLIEETPAPNLRPGLDDEIGEASVRAAQQLGYVGAGTFEYLVDPDGAWFFIEANCRIQVEHPVTEMVTGLDVVREQLRVAAGLPLELRQADVRRTGVSIECRINAEDPTRDFAPTPGLLSEFRAPGGPFVRFDTHAYAGYRVPAAYDSLLAKLVVWAPDRAQAIARMARSLQELHVAGAGVHTTRAFLAEVLNHPRFRAATHNTALVPAVIEARERERRAGGAADVARAAVSRTQGGTA